MPDMSKPLDVMEAQVDNLTFKARALYAEVATLTARARQVEEIRDQLERDLSQVRKYAPQEEGAES